MPALSFTLNQLAAALLGAGAYIYATQRGQWSACAVVCGCLIRRSSPDPYAALGAVAQVLIDYEAQQAAQDLAATPAARAAYRAAWAASKGQPVPARFAAAEAAAAATEATDWPTTIRTEQDNARTMQRLNAITGRASAASAAIGDELLEDEDERTRCPQCGRVGFYDNGICPQCEAYNEVDDYGDNY